MEPDSYQTFYLMFLAEMPMRVNGSNDFEFQVEALRENIRDGYETTPLTSNAFKLSAGNQVTYWVGNYEATNVQLIVDTEITSDFCKIVLTSKNPMLEKSSQPFASDLYNIILTDVKATKLSLSSDSMMSDNAVDLWKRLHSQGRAVAVFDRENHQYVLTSINNSNELDRYIGGLDKSRYVFIISENTLLLGGTKHFVKLMEIKRKSGYPLNEIFNYYKEKYVNQ